MAPIPSFMTGQRVGPAGQAWPGFLSPQPARPGDTLDPYQFLINRGGCNWWSGLSHSNKYAALQNALHASGSSPVIYAIIERQIVVLDNYCSALRARQAELATRAVTSPYAPSFLGGPPAAPIRFERASWRIAPALPAGQASDPPSRPAPAGTIRADSTAQDAPSFPWLPVAGVVLVAAAGAYWAYGRRSTQPRSRR